MIRFEEKPSEPKESAKKSTKAEAKPVGSPAPEPATHGEAGASGDLLGDTPAAASKKRGAPRKPRKT